MSHTTYNTNCKLLFILGVTILSLFLIAAITTPLTTSIVFAQDDKEEEEKEEDKEDSTKEEKEGEEEKEEDSSKDEEKEEESSEEQQESTEEQPISSVINNTATPTTEPIVNLTGDQILNPEPVTNPPQIISTTVAQPVAETAEPIKEFNATCKCMTTSGNNTPPPPSLSPIQPPQPVSISQQIPITNADIQDFKSYGEVVDPVYTNFYSVPNLLDTVINDVSFWSQAGKSSFYMKLDGALDDYQVCSLELNVYDPKAGVPFLLDIGVTQNYTGVINQNTEKIQFEKCVKNMDEILMIFDNPPGSFVSIGELKLFGSKIGTTVSPTISNHHPILQQQQQQPSTSTTENASKINIQDSTAEIDIKNSTVTFKFDPMTATFVQQQQEEGGGTKQ